MTRIPAWPCLLLGVALATPAGAASPARAAGAADGSTARAMLLEARGFDLHHIATPSGNRWRLGDGPAEPRVDDDGDLRVRVKLRPNKAMGRVSLSF